MSKVKTNNFDQAEKEITAMDPELIKKIPSEIPSRESKMYHVALIKIQPRPNDVKNEVQLNVQQYHERGFEKIEKSFVFQGFNKLVVVHNPNKPVERVPQVIASAQTSVQPKGDGNGPAKKQNAGKTPENDPEPTQAEQLEKEYQFAITGNKAELVDFAEKKEIDLTKASNNDERKEAITDWFNAKMEKLDGQS